MLKKLLKILSPIIDVMMVVLVYESAIILKAIRKFGVKRLPKSKNALMKIGVFPIVDHYYEPKFNYKEKTETNSLDRNLPGIDLNIDEQLEFLNKFIYSDELVKLFSKPYSKDGFEYGNGSFESGDAEYWYQIIRTVKPMKIIEIGSGNSTKIAKIAIERNKVDNNLYECDHICIEPYAMKWLETYGVTVKRERVECIDISFFESLENDDILFIDSSHVIRPNGDVLFEYLEILPSLKKGVIVHVHDIFTPRDYLDEWIKDEVKFWNEQYLLEAFLTNNSHWKVLGAVNYLHHNHYESLNKIAPFLKAEREPGSFYIKKIHD